LSKVYRTRADPLDEIWPEAERWLEATPEVEAKALFEHLLGQRPGVADGRALRTFQRRVTQWRAQHGPPKEVFFPQVHEPGRMIQVDWTYATELVVTIAGRPFPHLLCHAVLPYSNWEWAQPCHTESLLSLKSGLQAALWTLGGVPAEVQTDHSSTATHVLQRGQPERGFNAEYLALCAHLGLAPRTIQVACPNQNGDVEAAQGHLKRRLKNHLLLRGSRDFIDEAAYAAFVAGVCVGANALRSGKTAEELPRLRPLPATRFPQTEEITVRVSSYATVRVKNCAYSVPARLIGAIVQAYVSEAEVSFHHRGVEVARYPRSHKQQPRIDYRHVIDSLVRKPGAFARYLYREELFPRPVFRQAYDRLKVIEESQADFRYVRLLALAAQVGEDGVAAALAALLREGLAPLPEATQARLQLAPPTRPVELVAFVPELHSYDTLLVAEVGT